MLFVRRLFFTIIVFVFLISSVSAQGAEIGPFSFDAPPQYGLTAKSAILIEASTGRVIFEKNADAREYPASMTKMMTAILSLELAKPDDIVHVSDEAANVEGSSLYLEKGDAISMAELCQGMMLISGNDAAVAIADSISGNTADFVKLMNKKAAEVGAVNTHFANPNGLPNPDHYSTARDIAKIADYCYQNESFRKIVSVKEKEIQWITPAKKEMLYNTNHLLWNYPYADGIKTGYTDDAGGCLTASATRDGVTLIAVVMHTDSEPDKFSEAKQLLNYGFQKVRMQSAYSKSDLTRAVHIHDGEIPEINAAPQTDIYYPLIDGEDSSAYSIKINVPRYVDAPVKAGDKVGTVDIFYNDKKVNEVPMLADNSSEKGLNFKSLCYALYDSIVNLFVA